MQDPIEFITPPPSPRQTEAKRLLAQTYGMFAPARCAASEAARAALVQQHIREGLQKLDAQQNQNQQDPNNPAMR